MTLVATDAYQKFRIQEAGVAASILRTAER